MVRLFRPLLVLAPLLLAAHAAGAVALMIDGDGGDAWTFRQQIHGTIVGGNCEQVLAIGPGGSVAATLDRRHFSATVALQEGVNDLRALCRGDGMDDAASPPQRWIERLPDAPKAQARAMVSRAGLTLDATLSRPAAGHAAAILDYEWRAAEGNPAPLQAAGEAASLDAAALTGEHIVLRPPAVDGTYAITLKVLDAFGRTDTSTALFRVEGGAMRTIDPAHYRPAWVDDAVVYGAVPLLFGPHGLADVTHRLDAIAALGATVLWLSPITDAPDGDFGYAVTDHFHLRAALGSEADLRALVQAAHARGLRVVLDVAANHLSDRHRYFLDAARLGRNSAYAGFFARDPAGRPTHYFNWTNLENLNYDNPEVRNYALEAFARWVRDFDVDGFRVDAAWAVRERAPDFWPRWRAELKRIKPDLLLLAEAPARDAYYGENGFDAAYDWTDKLGEWAWQAAFESTDPAEGLRRLLAKASAGSALTFRFLDNNDTGARFATRHGIERTRVAVAMLLTLPGLPCIYMGDEVGAAFLPYGEKKPIDWADPAGLTGYYARLVALRHAQPALRSRVLTPVATSPTENVLAYLRGAPGQGLLVLLNYGAEAKTVSLAPTDGLADVLAGGRLVDLVGGGALAVDPAAPRVKLPAFSALVLRRAQES